MRFLHVGNFRDLTASSNGNQVQNKLMALTKICGEIKQKSVLEQKGKFAFSLI